MEASKPEVADEVRRNMLGKPVASRRQSKRTRKRSGTGDRFALLNWFNDTQARDLSLVAQVVWSALFREARENVSGISQQQIADLRGVSRRSVQKGIQELVERGLIEVVAEGRQNRVAARYLLRGPN